MEECSKCRAIVEEVHSVSKGGHDKVCGSCLAAMYSRLKATHRQMKFDRKYSDAKRVATLAAAGRTAFTYDQLEGFVTNAAQTWGDMGAGDLVILEIDNRKEEVRLTIEEGGDHPDTTV